MLGEGDNVVGARRPAPGSLTSARRDVDLQGDRSTTDWPEVQRIQALPWGVVKPTDGRGPWIVNEVSKVLVLANFRSRKVDLATDYDHASLGGPTSVAPASGWVENIEVLSPAESDHPGVWLTVRWTPPARAKLAAREYRYFSPVFFLDSENVVVKIGGGGITNTPALHDILPVAARTDAPAGVDRPSPFGPDFDRVFAETLAAAREPREEYMNDPLSGQILRGTEWGGVVATARARELQLEFQHLASPANLAREGFSFAVKVFQSALEQHDVEGLQVAVDEARRLAGRL